MRRGRSELPCFAEYPVPTVARPHSHHASRCCPVCKLRFRECTCESVDHSKLPNPPHQAREWGYKGPMVLPPDRPDAPKPVLTT
jgi:hypothetical protein